MTLLARIACRRRTAIVMVALCCGTALAADRTKIASMQGLDPSAVAVLPVEALSTNPEFEQLANAVYDEIIRRMQAIEGVNVINKDLVLPFSPTEVDAYEIGRQLGAAHVIKASVASHTGGYQIRYGVIFVPKEDDYSTGFGLSETTWQPGERLGQRATTIIDGMVSVIEGYLYPDRARNDWQSAKADARIRFLDASLGDRARLRALNELQPPTMGGAYPRAYADGGESMAGEVAMTAAQLGAQSKDPIVRGGMWRAMTGVADTTLVDPLLLALANDPVANVRVAAAEALAYHLDEPGVRSALVEASEQDPEASVKRAAYLSTASREQQIAALRQTTMNESLSANDRRMALYRIWDFLRSDELVLDDDLAHSLIEFAESTSSARIRSQVRVVLSESDNRIAVDFLLHALASATDENEREGVVDALRKHLDQPDVQSAIARIATDDPSPLVRHAAEKHLREAAAHP